VVAVGTATVVTVKVALVAPARMVTLGGTAAPAELLLESETTTPAPPAGAGAFSATVPIDDEPPVTLAGLSVSEVRLGPEAGCGVMVSTALCCTPA